MKNMLKTMLALLISTLLGAVVCYLPVPQHYVSDDGLREPMANNSDIDSEYIAGGSDAKVGDVPHIVSLGAPYHICGGSILDKRNVLTAAHCVYFQTPSDIMVRFGSLLHGSGGTQVGVSKIVKHDGYSPSTLDCDIAVLHLKSDISIDGSNVKAVALPNSELSADTDVLVAGWGGNRSSDTPSDTLQKVTMPIVDKVKCEGIFAGQKPALTERMICAGLPNEGKDGCKGDSGGPLTRDGVQYGVVSWGMMCGTQYPGVYANVANLSQWIINNMA